MSLLFFFPMNSFVNGEILGVLIVSCVFHFFKVAPESAKVLNLLQETA